MITEQMARKMMKKLRNLKQKLSKNNTEENREALKQYEQQCLQELKYFVHMKTSRYRKFSNYEDLNQEGLDALLKAMRTFKNKRGSFFYWAGLFVNTRLSRAANNHSAIRYPMYIAKIIKPHKESNFPIMLDTKLSPENITENTEISQIIQKSFSSLNSEQKELINMVYGFNGDKPMSIAKVCKKMNISRSNCMKVLNGALYILKQKIEL
jgi:RNA polymerase sigma factor (sigma-70 family)